MDLVQFIGRFHVLVLHLPIGILLMAAVIEGYGSIWSTKRPKMLNTIWLWGFLSATAACTLGYMLSLGGGYQPDALATHRTWGIAVAVFALLCWLLFRSNVFSVKPLVVSVCSLQLFILFSTGHYGANMTHGSTYLFEYAPNTLRHLAGMPPHEQPRPEIVDVEKADVYLDIIKPALKTRCVSCHNPDKSKGQLDLTRHASLLKGGESGPAISAGNLRQSELFQRITLDNRDKKYMPADGKTPLREEQVDAIKWWITAGAPEQGLVEDLSMSIEDKKRLARALGLEASAGAWPLKPVSAMPDQLRVELEKHGFLTKKIAANINYIDVDFSIAGSPLTDAALDSLVAAKAYIARLNLSDSDVSDKQLSAIAQLTNLLRLRLEKNPISNSGVQHLTALTNLEYLNLYGTQIDDGAFNSLEKIQALRSVYLMMTNVSSTGITKYSEKVDGLVEVVAGGLVTGDTATESTIIKSTISRISNDTEPSPST